MTTTFDLSNYATEYVEPQAVAADEEYELRIIGVDPRENENGPFVMVRLEVIGHDEALDINQYLGFPGADRDAKQNNRIIKRLKQFCDAFELPDPLAGTFTPEDWVGASGWAILAQEEYEGEMQNRVKKVIARK